MVCFRSIIRLLVSQSITPEHRMCNINLIINLREIFAILYNLEEKEHPRLFPFDFIPEKNKKVLLNIKSLVKGKSDCF